MDLLQVGERWELWQGVRRVRGTRGKATQTQHPATGKQSMNTTEPNRSSSSSTDASLGIKVPDSCEVTTITAGVRNHLH